jgi:hypothetical protein
MHFIRQCEKLANLCHTVENSGYIDQNISLGISLDVLCQNNVAENDEAAIFWSRDHVTVYYQYRGSRS